MATVTAEQRRHAARHDFDAYLRVCPSHQLLGVLSDKWVVLVLCALADGPLRHSELRRTIPSVSQKMLTQTLRTLERDGFVDRTITASVPVRVDYALTDLGHELQPVISALKTWAEANIERIHEARRGFDDAADESGSA